MAPADERRLTDQSGHAGPRDALEQRIKRFADDRRRVEPQQETARGGEKLVDSYRFPRAHREVPHVLRICLEGKRLKRGPGETCGELLAIDRGQSEIEHDTGVLPMVAVPLGARE